MCVPLVREDGILIIPGQKHPEPVRFVPAERFITNARDAVLRKRVNMLQARPIAGVLGVISDTAVPGIPIVPQKDSTFGTDITIFCVPAATPLTAVNGAVCTVTSVL